MSNLTDARIAEIGAEVHRFLESNEGEWGQVFARAIESAVLAKIASPIPIDARPLHPNHRPDLRYVRKVLDDVRTLALVEGDKLCGDVDAAVNGMDYIIKRTEEAASTTPEPSPLVAPRWQTIESAPKGDVISLWHEDYAAPVTGHLLAGDDLWGIYAPDTPMLFQKHLLPKPTHWQQPATPPKDHQ